MSDQIHLRIGAEPWRPADTAKIDKILNHYDIPLSGIIQQHRRYYIFECLDGHGNTSNLWAYAEISRQERRQILKAKGQSELSRLFTSILKSRSFTAAVAIDHGLEMAATVDQADRAPVKAASTAITRKADTVRAVDGLAAC
ncbi:hypothetical protein [Nonomuraea basaltis]|uniref:hypothetical protein n=1 Tax=Nonomuraea basaltis TaxID=2495887 RepID=UPI00110C490F|nr:hypothetical protein [Nonomuraea basaltis]TMR96699.1 hypothetical protein EJK15_21935 [Nonomuraea basaltis]